MKLTKERFLIESLSILTSIFIGLVIAWVSGEYFDKAYRITGLVYMVFFMAGVILSSRNSAPKECIGIIIPLMLPIFIVTFFGFSFGSSSSTPFLLALIVTALCTVFFIGFVYLGFYFREQIKKLIMLEIKIH